MADMSQLWNYAGVFVGGSIVSIASAIYARRDERRQRERQLTPKIPLEVNYRIDTEIHILLDRLLSELNCQRAYLSKFHNGFRFMDGSEIQKKTRTAERVRPGIAYQHESFRGMLISTMQEEMALVLEDGPSYKLVRDLPECKFKWLCREGGVRAVARCKVVVHGAIVGFVGVDMDTTEEPPPNIDEVCKCAEQISRWLSQNVPPLS